MNIPLTPLRFLRYAERQYPTRTAVVCKEKRYNYKSSPIVPAVLPVPCTRAVSSPVIGWLF